MNVEESIKKYLDGTNGSDGQKPDARYASFDYCFNYFQSFREAGNVGAIAEPEHVQLSCLHLGFYLASWGMFRGSADLLQKSARHLVPAIKLIARANATLWEIDAHCYTEPNIRQLLDTGRAFRHAYPGMSDILVTKLMLGVFGNVPAFDMNFKKGFQVATFGPKALQHRDRQISSTHARFCERRAHVAEIHSCKGNRYGVLYRRYVMSTRRITRCCTRHARARG